MPKLLTQPVKKSKKNTSLPKAAPVCPRKRKIRSVTEDLVKHFIGAKEQMLKQVARRLLGKKPQQKDWSRFELKHPVSTSNEEHLFFDGAKVGTFEISFPRGTGPTLTFYPTTSLLEDE